jgi:hypothetical protein
MIASAWLVGFLVPEHAEKPPAEAQRMLFSRMATITKPFFRVGPIHLCSDIALAASRFILMESSNSRITRSRALVSK